MLINAGARNGGGPMRYFAAPSLQMGERNKWLQPGMMRNITCGDARQTDAEIAGGYPNGYRHPGSWSMPNKTGAMASRFTAGGVGLLAGLIAGGVNISADLEGSGSLSADITYILFVEASADLSGSGSISSADLTKITFIDISADLVGIGLLAADGSYLAFVNGSATLSGSGSLSADISAAVNAEATLSGSGGLTADGFVTAEMAADLAGSSSLTATLRAIGEFIANLQGSGGITGTPRAIGEMSAAVSVSGGGGETLTPGSVAAAVWNALADDYQSLATTGGQARFSYLLAHNKTVTDPVAGTITVYDTDGTTVLFQADLFEDAAGTQPYRGQGAERREGM